MRNPAQQVIIGREMLAFLSLPSGTHDTRVILCVPHETPECFRDIRLQVFPPTIDALGGRQNVGCSHTPTHCDPWSQSGALAARI
jgi:hypothetical protein